MAAFSANNVLIIKLFPPRKSQQFPYFLSNKNTTNSSFPIWTWYNIKKFSLSVNITFNIKYNICNSSQPIKTRRWKNFYIFEALKGSTCTVFYLCMNVSFKKVLNTEIKTYNIEENCNTTNKHWSFINSLNSSEKKPKQHIHFSTANALKQFHEYQFGRKFIFKKEFLQQTKRTTHKKCSIKKVLSKIS